MSSSEVVTQKSTKWIVDTLMNGDYDDLDEVAPLAADKIMFLQDQVNKLCYERRKLLNGSKQGVS